MTVTIYELDQDAHDVRVGTIRYMDGHFHLDPADSALLRNIAQGSVIVREEGTPQRTVYAKDEPEVFMRGLHRHYKSAYLRASEVSE